MTPTDRSRIAKVLRAAADTLDPQGVVSAKALLHLNMRHWKGTEKDVAQGVFPLVLKKLKSRSKPTKGLYRETSTARGKYAPVTNSFEILKLVDVTPEYLRVLFRGKQETDDFSGDKFEYQNHRRDYNPLHPAVHEGMNEDFVLERHGFPSEVPDTWDDITALVWEDTLDVWWFPNDLWEQGDAEVIAEALVDKIMDKFNEKVDEVEQHWTWVRRNIEHVEDSPAYDKFMNPY